jgi:hypothetical protein
VVVTKVSNRVRKRSSPSRSGPNDESPLCLEASNGEVREYQRMKGIRHGEVSFLLQASKKRSQVSGMQVALT